MDIDPPVDEPAERPALSPTDRRTRVEEVIDEGDKQATIIDKYPVVAGAGMIKRTDASPHQHAYDALRDGNTNVYSPFANRVEWEIAQWVKNEGISDAAFDRFCDLPSMRNENGLRVENARQLNQKIDQLPGYGAWQQRTISIQAEGSTQLQSHEVFYRDPMDCLRALWADPAFQAELMVSPEMRWFSKSRTIRMYLDMNTGDWWNAKQVRAAHYTILTDSKFLQGNLPFGATVVPIIISTDKTELSMFSGEAAAYPIYMTIGNIPSYIRRQPSRRAQILIGYLPVSAIDKTELTDLAARNARAQLFHEAVRAILEPLRIAAASGVELTDSKGNVRDAFPLLAAYVADYPEQCLVACTRYGSRCPKCDIGRDAFAAGIAGSPRIVEETLARIHDAAAANDSLSAIDEYLRTFGINYIPHPFWEGWPHADIHLSITPDILHQLYQGVIKHLTAWATTIVGEAELDARFKRVLPAYGLRYFKDGISGLQRVSGLEHKAIAKVLLGCLAGAPQKDAVRAARALLDFTYLAQYTCHSTDTLAMMDESLADFHKYKAVFLNTGAAESLDLPKLHSLVHYVPSIRLFGTTDGYNTEQTERLHIDYAKQAYGASNHRENDIFPFMCTWLERREKMFKFATHLADENNTTYVALKRKPSGRPRLPVDFAKAPNGRSRTVRQIVAEHGAVSFAEHLVPFIKTYVRTEWAKKHKNTPVPAYTIPALDTIGFDTWNKVTFNTPDVQTLHAPDTVDVAFASPAHKTKAKTLPARFDPVMVEINGDGVAGEGGMEGIRAGQLRVLFEIPEHVQISIFDRLHIPRPGKLAYLEWFSKLGAPDEVTGMYAVKRSMRSGNRASERQACIVEAIDLRRSCHFIVKLGARDTGIPLHLNINRRIVQFIDSTIVTVVGRVLQSSQNEQSSQSTGGSAAKSEPAAPAASRAPDAREQPEQPEQTGLLPSSGFLQMSPSPS
ncbi:hypothetical protein EXIGLDRAFT_769682 [Exidia glandulosa HHB12029]|uniref:Uncharacterized protein n=1 Tax=Exidia glandulosa HHB12029 TaxID=1314781 RepID=A0A165H981_EXIGL|nr:hypothetical protein EXIGLDRAFT_769682 [Exidia glandulosa HHB12029]